MFINQKTQEISYVLLRVAPYIRKVELRQRIERLAFQLLEDAASESFEQGLKDLAGLDALINIGKAIYEIEPVNAKIIIGELNLLKSAMRQAMGLGESPEESPKLEEFFSKAPAVITDDQSGNPAISEDIRQEELPQSSGIAATIRQSAIIERIRQFGNSAIRQIQLRDLLAAFPEISERTMRYDLQKLCSQELIERIGNGGPGSYYTLKS